VLGGIISVFVEAFVFVSLSLVGPGALSTRSSSASPCNLHALEFAPFHAGREDDYVSKKCGSLHGLQDVSK